MSKPNFSDQVLAALAAVQRVITQRRQIAKVDKQVHSALRLGVFA